MKKFTESVKSNPELSGWALWSDNGMHKVEFAIENGEFNARADGEIWDYSDDPYDFAKSIKDGNIYTSIEIKENKVEYSNPTSLTNWIKTNTRNVFNIIEELSDIHDYFQEFFDRSNESWKIEIKTENHQYEYEDGVIKKIDLDKSNKIYNPSNGYLSIIVFNKKIMRYDKSSILDEKNEDDNLIKTISEIISESKNINLFKIFKYKSEHGRKLLDLPKGYEIVYEIPK